MAPPRPRLATPPVARHHASLAFHITSSHQPQLRTPHHQTAIRHQPSALKAPGTATSFKWPAAGRVRHPQARREHAAQAHTSRAKQRSTNMQRALLINKHPNRPEPSSAIASLGGLTKGLQTVRARTLASTINQPSRPSSALQHAHAEPRQGSQPAQGSTQQQLPKLPLPAATAAAWAKASLPPSLLLPAAVAAAAGEQPPSSL